MKVGKVIGSVWATRKEQKLNGLKLLIVEPQRLNTSGGDEPFVAADIIGAGVGESVIVVSGSSARGAAGDPQIPVDATVVGIIDDMEIAKS